MMVRVLDAALVDRMVEDLRTLGKINELVAEGRRTGASQRGQDRAAGSERPPRKCDGCPT